MKKRRLREEKPQTLKKKLVSAFAMLMVATLMLSTSTFAWFVLSTAPEVTGIETQVGANGSLEIALLNTETRANMSTIRAGLGGGSLQENKKSANEVWGNLIDLGYTEYGLGELTLLPARLWVDGTGSVSDANKMLAVPTYGFDGRIIKLDADTASAIYQTTEKEKGFLYSGAQDYGVRAIGTNDALSPQGSALSSAKTNINTWTKSARSGAQTALNKNMEGLFNIIVTHAGIMGTKDAFDDSHKATLDAFLSDLNVSLNYIENSLRYGLVAYAASTISDIDQFTSLRDTIIDSDNSLSSLLINVSNVPDTFKAWVNQYESMKNKYGDAFAICSDMEKVDGYYTWDDIRNVLDNILNTEMVKIDGKTIDQINADSFIGGGSVEMTLEPGSGLFADVADFTGNYTASASYMGILNVDVVTLSTTAHLETLLTAVETLRAADGGDSATALPLTATYGYAIDLAFRCNAADPDLVLQTMGVQRVYSGNEDGEEIYSDNSNTQGGGSYMEFTSNDSGFTQEQRLALMDAIRVGFIDDQGTILGIAKLNVTSREISDDGLIKAPLYLYNYTFEADEVGGGYILTMGERKLADNQITKLEQNVAKAVTAVVWLDGDIVDNTMVSATEAASLDGVLNLQFATSAELIPAEEKGILEYTADTTGLVEALADAKKAVLGEEADIENVELTAQHQGTYTNVSWNTFIAAYRRAQTVNGNASASQVEIRNAINALKDAQPLEVVSNATLANATKAVREIMGSVDGSIGAYVYDYTSEDKGYVAEYEKRTSDPTEEVAILNRVDNSKNIKDEGHDVLTAVYTDESWNNLADALYQAEAVAMNAKATDDQINSALTVLEEAENALEFAVYYIPYEYNGHLFYMARSEVNAEDTYGRWYDADFNRVTADVTILKLNAYAKQTAIAEIAQSDYVVNYPDYVGEYITPDIEFLTRAYPSLDAMEVKAVHWTAIDTDLFSEMMSSGHYSRLCSMLDRLSSEEFKDVDISSANEEMAAAQSVIDAYNAYYDPEQPDASEPTAAMARNAINNLEAAIKALGTSDESTVQKIPGFFDSDEFVYTVEYPGHKLRLTEESGPTTFSATVLTKSGVLFNVSKEIHICDAADGAQIWMDYEVVHNITLEEGESADVGADFIFSDNLYSRGYIYNEPIDSYTWASEKMSIAAVSGKQDNSAVVEAVGAGTTKVVVTIKTKTGSYYVGSVNVTVTAKPETPADPTEPTE